ncbi:MAG: ComEC/Rec2 family competence protein [Phycisphaerae bacterium]
MDSIQNKLMQLDRRMEGFGGLIRRCVITSPAMFIAAGLISGIVVQDVLNLPLWNWLSLSVLLFLAVLIIPFCLRHRRQNKRIANVIPSAIAVFLCASYLGAVRNISFSSPASNDIRNFVNDEPVLASIRGIIITEPYVNYGSDWKFSKFTHSDPSSSFYLKLTQAQAVTGWTNISGIIRVQISEPILDLNSGDCIEAYCTLERFKSAANPGQFSAAESFARRNIYVAAQIKSRDAITILENSDISSFAKIKNKIRHIASQAVLGDVLYEDNNRAVLEALLLGQRTNIDANTYRAFEKTGLLHFVSLSGMHLGILAAVIWWFCKLFGLLKPARAFVCILAISLFLIIVPARPPTVRAAIICFVFGFSILFRRKADPINSLSLAAVILLLIRPTGLFEPGWQLSFTSVLGILLLSNPMINYIKQKTFEFSLNPDSIGLFRYRGVLFIIELFLVGIGAWLGGAGVILYHFYTVNPLTSLWTVLTFPLVASILTVGFIKSLLWFLVPTLSIFLGSVLYHLSGILIWFVDLLSRIGLNEFLIGAVPLSLAAVYYVLLVFFAQDIIATPRIKKTAALIVILAAMIFAVYIRFLKNDLVLTCLDVGHGQAVVLQAKNKCFIFDAGSQYTRDVGTRIVKPFLKYKGISCADAIIISHDDVDHINGITELAASCRIKAVYSNAAFLKKTKQSGTAKFLADCLAEQGFEIQLLGDELYAGKNVSIKILWPDNSACQDEFLSDNDTSTVSMIEFAGRKILICSDIESIAQQRLLSRFEDLSPDVVLVPHHGSMNTMSEQFRKCIATADLICSSSRRFYLRQKQTVNRDKEKWFYTAEQGAIFVRISNSGKIEINGFKN